MDEALYHQHYMLMRDGRPVSNMFPNQPTPIMSSGTIIINALARAKSLKNPDVEFSVVDTDTNTTISRWRNGKRITL